MSNLTDDINPVESKAEVESKSEVESVSTKTVTDSKASEVVVAKQSKFPWLFLILGVIFVSIIGLVIWYFASANKSPDIIEQVTPTPKNPNAGMTIEDAQYVNFGSYELKTLDFTPKVKSYTPKSDLSDVYYLRADDPEGEYRAVLKSELTNPLKAALVKDYFAITPGTSKEFFQVYEQNRYANIPQFVTVDSVMHTYHLMFDSILKDLEKDSLAVTAQDLVKDMVDSSLDQYQLYSFDAELASAAKRNVAFFAVAAKIFDKNYTVPALVQTEVNQELALINAHSDSFVVSPVMSIGFDNPNLLDNVKEDYTQYIARGHYTKTEQLQNYFKAMMWLGRLTFLSKDKTTVQSALLITNIMKTDFDIFSKWESVYAPINFFVGKADDITFYEYGDIYDGIYGSDAFDPTGTLMDSFWTEVKKLSPPQINSIPIWDANIQPDREAEITGFRFMGQRFTVDAMIFQNLIYRSVEETDSGERKMLPTSLEVPAAMGNQRAIDLIKRDTNFYTYPNYSTQMTTLQQAIASLPQAQWTQNLYWSWIYTLNGMKGKLGEGYPDFMRSDKWAQKELNTYVGSWTELKHDTILYSKQAMAEMGDGGPRPDDKGYVEPNIEVWNRLLALVKMTKSGLLERELISSTNEIYCDSGIDSKERTFCNLSNLEAVVNNLMIISEKELLEENLTEDEYSFIRYIGGDLEAMFMSTLDPGSDKFAAVDENPSMLIADVAGNTSEALEEATGYIYNIYVLVPVEGQLRVAKGGVYSQYEFAVSSDKRMTDEEWRTMLSNNQQPEMLNWQKELITKP